MRLVDLSPTVPHGFRGPPSTDLGVQVDARVKEDAGGYWQSSQIALSCHTGCHVESARHVLASGETIDEVALDRIVGPAVVLDLTPVGERELIAPEQLERALGRPALTQEAARWIVALAPRCVGRDFFEEPAARAFAQVPG
jgi:arylformamidase